MNFDNVFKAMHKKALAGYSMPKGIGDALKPAPAAMKIDKPEQAVGNAQMDQAAAAEGVSTQNAGPSDPVSALTTSLDKITAVAKGLMPKAAPATAPTAQPDPNPAQVAQQQNQTIPQPGVPKMASSISKGKLFLYGMLKGMSKSAATTPVNPMIRPLPKNNNKMLQDMRGRAIDFGEVGTWQKPNGNWAMQTPNALVKFLSSQNTNDLARKVLGAKGARNRGFQYIPNVWRLSDEIKRK